MPTPVRGYHPLRPAFPERFRLSQTKHWPGPRSLATTSGVSVDVLSSRYLDVSVPWVRFLNLWIQFRIPLRVGCPIRKSTDQSLFAAPRSLSQRTTSFIASQRQGIHRTPLRHLIALMIDARRRSRARVIVRKTIACHHTRLNGAVTPSLVRQRCDSRLAGYGPLHDFKHPRLALRPARTL